SFSKFSSVYACNVMSKSDLVMPIKALRSLSLKKPNLIKGTVHLNKILPLEGEWKEGELLNEVCIFLRNVTSWSICCCVSMANKLYNFCPLKLHKSLSVCDWCKSLCLSCDCVVDPFSGVS